MKTNKTKLSLNINKFATLRNSRGENLPNLIQIVKDVQEYGVDGITIHPRPDERHITEQDALILRKYITTEYNIEGFPNSRLLKILAETLPDQVTLVPDKEHILTSNAGWNIKENFYFLQETIEKINMLYQLKKKNTSPKISIFIDPLKKNLKLAFDLNIHCIELFTDMYAKKKDIAPYREIATMANENNILVNAGHNLNLQNLYSFWSSIPFLNEVSIGHALICDALYFGIKKTIHLYKQCLQKKK